MKKIFKLTIFKKFFLTILCGFLFVEGMHIYLDYQNNLHTVEMNVFKNDVHFELDKLWKLLPENKVITQTMIDKITKEYDGHFIFTDSKKNIINHIYNTSYDNGESDFFLFKYDKDGKVAVDEPAFIDLTKIDSEVINKINNFIKNNPTGPLTVYCEGIKGSELLADTFIEVSSLKINDYTIIGDGIKTDNPYYIFRYYNKDLYYLYDTMDSNEPNIYIDIKSEQIKNMQNIFQDYSTDFEEIIYYHKEALRINDDLCSFYTICFKKADNLSFDYMTYIKINEGVYHNLFIRTIQDKWEIYFIACLFSIITSLVLSYIITKRIKNINKAAKFIADNNFNIRLNTKGHDELSELSSNINIMKDKLVETIDSLNNEIDRVTHLENLRKEFLTHFTHEIKTPLGIINGYIELLQNSSNEDKKSQYLYEIEKETKNVNELVLTMLCLSNLESGKVSLNKENTNLDEIFLTILDKFYNEILDKQIIINIDSQHSLIQADATQFEILINNFISYILKQSPSFCNIIIRDNYFSIEYGKTHLDSTQLTKIWDSYISEDRDGTGLKLAICKNILDLHKFRYDVTNTKDGIKFTIYTI